MSLLAGITHAIEASDDRERVRRLSDALSEVVPHRALAVFFDACARTPLTAVGEEGLAERIGIGDLAGLGSEPSGSARQGVGQVGGEELPVAVVHGPGGAGSTLLLVRRDEAALGDSQLATLSEAWTLFAIASQAALDFAPPGPLNASRAAAGERARVAAELADVHGAALAGVLGTLRASHLDDRAARQAATDLASTALIDLRAAADRERELGDEPVADAFARLRTELTPLTRFSTARLELAAPEGEASLPAPVAQAARAVTRSGVLSLLEQDGVERVRIAWTVGGELEISIRDDGPGDLGDPAAVTGLLAERARALGGTVSLDTVPGWGAQLTIRLPLADVTGADASADDPLATLRPRELEVLAELALGRRNREIAETLSISENTVKFHVANVFAKLGVSSRGQAAIIARDAGYGADSIHAV